MNNNFPYDKYKYNYDKKIFIEDETEDGAGCLIAKNQYNNFIRSSENNTLHPLMSADSTKIMLRNLYLQNIEKQCDKNK